MCESNSLQRIVAMDCSRKQLHAVQLVIMHLTTMANGCNVYLSRKPCTECAKCLVQGKTYTLQNHSLQNSSFPLSPSPKLLVLAVEMKISLILNQVHLFFHIIGNEDCEAILKVMSSTHGRPGQWRRVPNTCLPMSFQRCCSTCWCYSRILCSMQDSSNCNSLWLKIMRLMQMIEWLSHRQLNLTS